MFRVKDLEEYNVSKCLGVIAKWLTIADGQILEEGPENRI